METEQTIQSTTSIVEIENPVSPATITESIPIAIGTAQAAENNEQNVTEAEKHSYKLSEEEFIEELEENNGLYAQTARAIRRNYGITYSRQAVRDRARNYYNLISDQKEKMIDLAKGTIFDAIEQNTDKKLKFRASSFLISKLKYERYQGGSF